MVEQLGLVKLLSLPRSIVTRSPTPEPVSAAQRLRLALIELGPTFVKMGQLLSTRPDIIPPVFMEELNKLQSEVPPFSNDLAIATIERELEKPIHTLFREFCREPVAAASLGQVHAARLRNGQEVMVKVQRPDITETIESDLAIINDLAALAEERNILGEGFSPVELAAEFSITLRSELDYRHEASNADRFRSNFKGNRMIYIPTIYWDYSSRRVLTTERLYGVKITDLQGMAKEGIDRKKMARNCLKIILEEIFKHGFFHADPHPGNFFAMRGEVLGAIDFGQMGVLDREMTGHMLYLMMSLVNRDSRGILRAFERMGSIEHHRITPALERDVQRFINNYIDRPLAEMTMSETGNEIIAITQRHNMWLPGTFAVLIKSMVMTEGIGLQLDPNLDVFGIARPFVQQAFAEQFSSRKLGERLLKSGSELGEALISLPQQSNDLLYRINEGELHIQTHEQEMRRLSGALIGAANRLAIAVVLASSILGLALVAVAVAVSNGFSDPLTLVLSVLGIFGLLTVVFVLALALLRGKDR
jgi:ubiquinone biosynthesis protein